MRTGNGDAGESTVGTAGNQRVGNTVRKGTGGSSTGAAIWSNDTDTRTSSGGPFQSREKSANSAGNQEGTQEGEGSSDGGGMDHEVQGRAGGGT